MLLGMTGCASDTPAAETVGVAQSASAPTQAAETEPTTPPETEAPKPEGYPYLKVSAISLSVAGDSEDIYLGLLDRADVTFESDDTSVATFEGGVLTATGVGETTVRAISGENVVECQVSCLANTEEELLTLPNSILCQPRRLPPNVDLSTACVDFDDAVIIGDSITLYMFQWESQKNQLGDVVFLTRGGVSLNGFVKRFKNIYYRGAEMNLEDAIAATGRKNIYLMLGSNDLSSKARTIVMDNWAILLERIREKSPDVNIYLQSSIPEYTFDDSLQEKNRMIADYNEQVRQFAAENDCHYIDLGYYIRDHKDRMPEMYSQGNYHMNEAGCLAWMQILRFYRAYELAGGTLS